MVPPAECACLIPLTAFPVVTEALGVLMGLAVSHCACSTYFHVFFAIYMSFLMKDLFKYFLHLKNYVDYFFVLSFESFKIYFEYKVFILQAYFGDTEGLVPDHHHEVNMAIKRVT